MKKIFLGSNGTFINKNIAKAVGKPAKEIKLAYITTASKGVSNTGYIEANKKMMAELGINYQEIDIEGKTSLELWNMLEHKDAVYLSGGNTFYLLKAARESGFVKVIKDLIEKGVVYLGESAGAYLACPTIEMADWKHQDKYNEMVAKFILL
ncbi:Type 1 glutamine amidotransferase-like domain-containing protein [Patescibacteria group bacterium]|nr:Type 1 glutamine amidotransferase-like domain-containing protein [Patescibacteria group bacterium]